MSMPEHPPLPEIQRRFFGYVRRRLDDHYRMTPLPEQGPLSQAALEALVKPNDRLTSNERIELYARQYWFRLIDSFTEDFPGVAALLDNETFKTLMLDYLDDHPSQSYTLRHLGRKFPEFVRTASSIPEALRPPVIDMADLEWAKMEVFDAAEQPALDPNDAIDHDLTTLPIGLQPHLRLLELAHPVDDWLVRLHREEWRAEASNAVAADAPHAHATERLAPPRRRKTRVVVHRHHETAYFKRVPAEAFRLLNAFASGQTLGEALAVIVPESGKSDAWWGKHLKKWFAEWTALHWLVRRP